MPGNPFESGGSISCGKLVGAKMAQIPVFLVKNGTFWKSGDFMVYCVFFDPPASFGTIWCGFHLVGGLFCATIAHLVVKAIFCHFKLILLFNYTIWPHLRPPGRVRKPKSSVNVQTTLTSGTVLLSPLLKDRVHILTEHTPFWRFLRGHHNDRSHWP